MCGGCLRPCFADLFFDPDFRFRQYFFHYLQMGHRTVAVTLGLFCACPDPAIRGSRCGACPATRGQIVTAARMNDMPPNRGIESARSLPTRIWRWCPWRMPSQSFSFSVTSGQTLNAST